MSGIFFAAAIALLGGIEERPLERDLNQLRLATQVRWNSETHAHDFFDLKTEEAVKRLVHRALHRAEDFDSEFKALPKELQTAFFSDTNDSRVEPLDVISNAFKQALELHLATFNRKFASDRSQLWSISKSRFRRLSGTRPHSMIIREVGERSDRALFLCSHPDSRSGSFGGIKMREFRLPKGEVRVEHCGEAKFELAATDFSIPSELPVPAQSERAAVSTPTRVLGIIGLVDSIDSDELGWFRWLLETRTGMKSVSDRLAPVKELLLEELPRVDWFIPFSDWVSDMETRVTRGFSEGRVIRFADVPDSPKFTLEIILPSGAGDERRAESITEEEWVKIFHSRTTPLSILELSCFADRMMGAWLGAFRKSASRQTPYIVLSQSGHAAESMLEIATQLEVVLSALSSVRRGDRRTDVLRRLDRPSFLAHTLAFFAKPFDLNASFKPIDNSERPFRSYLAPLKGSVTMAVKSLPDGTLRARHHPIPSGY